MCWLPIRIGRKKRRIRRQIAHLRPRSVVLVEDETKLLLFPPLRAAWGRKGEPTEVLLSGWNAHRIVFGTMNLRTGRRLFLVRKQQRKEDFQELLRLVRRHYRGWSVALVLDENPSHTAPSSLQLARQLRIKLLWLPKRSPELNPMDELWGQAKDLVSANKQRDTIDDHVTRFLRYLESLSNWEALNTSGVLSEDFWLKSVL